MDTIPYIGTNQFKCSLFDWSRQLWRDPRKGLAVAGFINFLYITICVSHLSLITLFCYISLIFIFTGIVLLQSKKTESTPSE